MSSSHHSHWRILKNVISLISGRLFISLSRFVIALIIIRLLNTEIFGAYVVVMSIIFIGEWLMDFGFTDIAVRNISQDKNNRLNILNAYTTIKTIQAFIAYGLVILTIYLLGYNELLPAVGVGGLALIFYGIAQIYRVDFRVNMSMDKDMLSESSGVLVMIILVFLLSYNGASVVELVACHALSRFIYLSGNMYFGAKNYKLAPSFKDSHYITVLVKQAAPLGLAGIMVACYDSVIPLVLSKLLDMDAVAQYTVAIRVVFPVVLITQAISNVFYTPLSKFWNSDKSQFISTQQNMVEFTWFIACGFICLIYNGSDFIVSFFGNSLTESAMILRLLSWAIIARAMTIAMSPPIIICGGQKKTMWLTLIVVIFSTFLIIYLVPIYGILGAVGAFLFIEIIVTAFPVIFVSMYMAKFRLSWLPILKVFLASVTAIALTSLLSYDGTIFSSMLSFILFVLLAFLLGGVSKQKMQTIFNVVKHRSTMNA